MTLSIGGGGCNGTARETLTAERKTNPKIKKSQLYLRLFLTRRSVFQATPPKRALVETSPPPECLRRAST